MVSTLFAFVAFPRRDQPYYRPPHGVGNGVNPPFNFAEDQPPLLAIGTAGALCILAAWVQKPAGGIIKRNAVLFDILRRLTQRHHV